MKSVTIKLDGIDKVKRFVNITNRYEGDFDLASNRYTVDAKSIMGIFSLNLSEPLKLSIHEGVDAEKFSAEIADFVV